MDGEGSRFGAGILRRTRSWWIPAGYGLVLSGVAPIHSIFDEWGGVMQYFAGGELLAGHGYRGWTAGFWPPLYSLLVGMGSHFAPGFEVGRAISMVSSVALLVVAYHLALRLTRHEGVAWSTQILLPLTPLYLYESLQAHNHMLDAFLFLSGLLLFLRAIQTSSMGRWIAAGLVCGLAALTRYTSAVLLVLPLVLVVAERWIPAGGPDPAVSSRRHVRGVLVFLLFFVAVGLPWWIVNARWNGSPFHTLEPLNVCVGIFRDQWRAHSLQMLWHAAGVSSCTNLWDVFTAFPHPYLLNMKMNLTRSLPLLMRLAGPAGWLLVPGFVLGLWSSTRRSWLIVCGVAAAYLVATSQAYQPEYALLGWSAPSLILGVWFLVWFVGRLRDRIAPEGHGRLVRTAGLLSWPLVTAALVVVALAAGGLKVAEYAGEENRPVAEASTVAAVLRVIDPELPGKVIMAIDPIWAYYAGSKYLETPMEYEGTAQGLVSYRGVSERLRRYAPKHPAGMPLDDLHADYLVVTRTAPDARWWSLREPRGFDYLLEPGSPRLPAGFVEVYRSEKVVVYRIEPEG